MDKKTIGIVGGGQLCLMMGEAVRDKNMPYKLIAVDPTPECPAFRVIDEQLVGDFKDEAQIKKLADSSDFVSFEIELAGSEVLAELSAKGKPIRPAPETLKIIQDKFTQAQFLREHGLPVPDFRAVEGREEIKSAAEEFGLPLMIKARKDSYDGRGNFVLRNLSEIDEVLKIFDGRELMAQRYIKFDLEVSVICARATNGEIKTFPVGENIHGVDYNILLTTIVPARVENSVVAEAKRIAERSMEALKGAGVFGIEALVVGGEVLINEIAPRVHNSGHYTIEACETSQFEQHIRAVAGDSLGSTELVCDAAVMRNTIGPEGYTGNYRMTFDGEIVEGTREVAKGVVVHNYGKHKVKPHRKMGHFTAISLLGESREELIARVEELDIKIKIEPEEK